MENNQRVAVSTSTLILVCAIFLASSIALFFLRQSEVDKRMVLERKVEVLEREKVKLSKEVDEAAVLKKDLEARLTSLEGKSASLEAQLESEKKDRDQVALQLDNEKKESKKLVDDLMKIKDEREQLSVSLSSLKSESDSLRVQLSSIQQAKEIVESRLKEVVAKNTDGSLEKIVVKPQPAENAASAEAFSPIDKAGSEVVVTAAAVPLPNAENPDIQSIPNKVTVNLPPSSEPPVKGEIQVVNKKFNFAVINLGEQNGLKAGANLAVYRNKKFLAMLQVEKVHASMCAAKIPDEWKSADLKEGDQVVVVK